MKLSILIRHKSARAALLDRLLSVLGPQVEKYPRDVEVLIRTHNPKWTIGEQRQMLVDEAKGAYVSFVDDADLVSFDYVNRILPLLGPTDTVGFKLLTVIGRGPGPLFIFKYGGGAGTPEAPCMPFFHKTPVLTEWVKMVKFEGGTDEDVRWLQRMLSLNIVQSGGFVDDVLYFHLVPSDKRFLFGDGS